MLNLTPVRSLKVHTLPSPLWLQLVASIGWSISFRLLSKTRNSPVWLSISRPPASETVSGLTAAAGVTPATVRFPPVFGGAAALLAADDEDDDELPQAARIVPSSVADIPIVLPRRRNVRRSMRPATSSSM